MSKINGLSVTIIVRNEEHDIEACLASVASLAEEIILVDSGSTDQTLAIARGFTDKIFHHDWQGYSVQKQFALDQAKGPWILNIDADERVTPALGKEIAGILNGSSMHTGYDIPFHHYFLGKRLRFGGSRGETHLRLFLKSQAAYGKEIVHEGIHVKGSLAKLGHPIDHQSYKSIEEYLEKCASYTSMIAQEKFNKGKRFHWWHHLRLPYEFVVRYFLKLGFLDGEAGLTYALLSSYYVWLKFLKLRDFKGNK